MRDACPPFTGHQHDQRAWQIVPEMQCNGQLARWPARGFALDTTPIATQASQAAPGTNSQLSLTCGCSNVYFDSLRAITFGPVDLHGDTATWLVGGQKVDDTRLEGEGAPAIRFVMTPTIRTHRFIWGGKARCRHRIILWPRAGWLIGHPQAGYTLR
jgi:hypothetical protein